MCIRDSNRSQPAYCVDRIARALNEDEKAVKGSRVLLLGIGYKAGVGDIRESRALENFDHEKERGVLTLSAPGESLCARSTAFSSTPSSQEVGSSPAPTPPPSPRPKPRPSLLRRLCGSSRRSS